MPIGKAKSHATLLNKNVLLSDKRKKRLPLFVKGVQLQKGGVPAAPSGTATLLRLSPNHRFCPRPLLDGYGLQAPPAFMA